MQILLGKDVPKMAAVKEALVQVVEGRLSRVGNTDTDN
jgi:hypothetical protein